MYNAAGVLNALSGDPAIEWNPTLNGIPAPTPTYFGSGTALTIPLGCGGDVTGCGGAGTFPGSPTVTYQVRAGTYTAVDLTETTQGGQTSDPVYVVNIAQVDGTIAGAGSEDYYSFYWAGGAFSASASLTNTTAGDTFAFTAGTAGTCNTLSSQTLNSGDSYSGTISLPSLAAGNYCIGLDETAGTDPDFSVTFNAPLTAPEPSGLILLATGLALICVVRRRAPRHEKAGTV